GADGEVEAGVDLSDDVVEGEGRGDVHDARAAGAVRHAEGAAGDAGAAVELREGGGGEDFPAPLFDGDGSSAQLGGGTGQAAGADRLLGGHQTRHLDRKGPLRSAAGGACGND